MTFNLGFDRARGDEILGAGLNEAEPAVDGQQLRTQAEDCDINSFAFLAAKMFLGGCNDPAPKAGSLVSRVYGKLSEVAAQAANFGVYTAQKAAGAVFSQQNFALAHHGRNPDFVRASALKEGFDGEGGVDEGNQARQVGFHRQAEMEWGAGVSVLRHSCLQQENEIVGVR